MNEINQTLAKSMKGFVVIGFFVVIFFIVVFGSFTIIGPGQRGVIVQFGKVSDRVMGEGLNFKMPVRDNIVKINVQTQTVQFDNQLDKGDNSEKSSMFCATKDLQDVQIAVIVNYHLDATKVNKTYQQYGSTYQANIIEPIIREVIKSQAALYTAEELVTKRAEFSDKVSLMLNEKIGSKDSVFERLNITNFQFSESFSKAIEAKVTAEQNALAAKNKLEQVKFEANQRVAQANGEAEAIKIQASAIQAQGGKEYVSLKWVEKWNGALPTTVLGDSVPMVSIAK
ncbi:MAG: prohibitin family protein [Planctomycetes bacterium]|jgi:regulator of protease activity HflC (stomatin/prohibitin superfamily)|nr:prohibitin family protein [Planctomycetota bacterium]